MNHKRRRPKHRRAGCLWCKPHKDDRARRETRRGEPLRIAVQEPPAPDPSDDYDAIVDPPAWLADREPVADARGTPHAREGAQHGDA